MTDTPVPTGLAGLVAEAKDVETKLEALLTPAPVTVAQSAPLSSPSPAAPASSPSISTDPAPAAVPASIPPTPVAVESAASPPSAASSMVISDVPIAAPPDAIPVPAAPAAPIQSSALDAAAAKEQARVTQLENEKNAFYKAVLEARQQNVPAAIVVPPIPERILAQTELEKAAGAAAVAAHAAAQGRRIIAATALPTDGTMTPVFRPADFVPDQKKGQGNVSGTPLT
jgi:hypothetical protein